MADLSSELFGNAQQAGSSGTDKSQELFNTAPQGSDKSAELFSSDAMPVANLRDNLDVPGRLVGPSLAKGVLNTEEAIASENLRKMTEGGSAEQFAQDVMMQPNPIGLVNAGVRQLANAVSKHFATPEDVAQQTQRVRTLQGAGREANADIASMMPENPSTALRGATFVTTNLGMNAPGLAASVLTKSPLPALASGALLAGGQASDTGLTVDPSDPNFAANTRKKTQLAEGLGAAEALLEFTPTKFLVDSLGETGVKGLIAKYIAKEVPAEVATTVVQDVYTKGLANPEQPLGDFLKQLSGDVLDTAMFTPFTAGVQGLAAHGISKLGEKEQQAAEAIKQGTDAAVVEGNAPAAEFGQNVLDGLNDELMGQSLNQKSAQQLVQPTPLSPQVEALIAADEPVSDVEFADLRKAVAPLAVAPEKLADGSTAQGLDSAFAGDMQIGNTQKVRNNAEGFEPNPNDAIPRSERTIVAGPEGAVGQTLGTIKTEPGTYVIGEPTADRSQDVLEGYHELFDELRQQFMPNATIVLSNETMPTRQAVGMMQKLSSGEYLIVPAFLRNFSGIGNAEQSAESFNQHTKAKAFYNIFHEFGHALMLDRALENVSPDVASTFIAESRTGKISDETLAGLPEGLAELAREYNQFRQDMKAKNAAWFQDQWMSPALAVQRQLISDMKGRPDMNAESFVRRLVSKGHPEIARLQAEQALAGTEQRVAISRQIDALQNALVQDYLSFDEFVAERMARYAHEKGLGGESKLAKGDYFAGGIQYVKNEEKLRGTLLNTTLAKIQDSLRELFTALKRGLKLPNGQEYRIAAGTAFDAWVKSLSQVGQAAQSTQIATTVKGARKAKAPKQTLPAIPDNIQAQQLRRTVTFGKFHPREKLELYKMIRRNELNSAHERMVEMLQSRVQKQLDPDVRRDDPQWDTKRTESPRFVDWFGDWRNEPERSSKVVTAKGQPLVVFHGTTQDVQQFDRGDLGYHFGNLMAAHARLYRSDPTQAAIQARIDLDEWRGMRDAEGGATWRAKDTGMNIIPAYLNIRNPLKLEYETPRMWNTPLELGHVLREQGVFSLGEFEKLYPRLIIDEKHVGFAAIRQELVAKGFDGIQYPNAVEGGTSWVAFEPTQVKSVNAEFNKHDPRIFMQRDVDLTTQTGIEMDTLSRTVERYEAMGLTARALRFLARGQWNLLQLQHLAWIHPEFHFLDLLSQASMQYQASKSRIQAVGDSVAKAWKGLSKEADAKLARVLEAEVAEGVHWTRLEKVGDEWVHTITADTLTKLREHGLTIDTPSGKAAIQVYKQSKEVQTKLLDVASQTLARQLGQRIPDQVELLHRLQELKKTFAEIRQLPFLPRGDYGAWGLVISEGTTVVHRQFFENEADLAKAREVLSKTLPPGQKIRTVSKLRDEQRAMLAMPTEYLDTAAEALDLTQDQRDLLHDLLFPVKQEKLLTPYAKALEKISGSSADRMRNFADFVWHNSTMIARVQAQDSFNAAKRAGNEAFAEMNAVPMEEKARQRALVDIKRAQIFMDNTIQYQLSPPNEWYKARSLVALLYLWGGMKTALLNLFGITTTWAALTSQHGDIAGNAAMLKAQKQLTQMLDKGQMDPGVAALYERAVAEGFISQSYAAHLASAATSGTQRRLGNRVRWSKEITGAFGQVTDAGMLPFSLVEQYTRVTTFLSTVNAMTTAAKAESKSPNMDAIYWEAVKQTDLLQNSYTLANRPGIMRGSSGTFSGLIPLFTIFLSFMEHLTFHAAGGYTLGVNRRAELLGLPKGKSALSSTQRMLLLMVLLGGYESLPGMENLLDLLDFFFQRTSGKTARQWIREGIQLLPDGDGYHWLNDPRWWARGLGGDIAGFDISASLGVGRLVPGTDVLAGSPQDATEAIGKVASSAMGVTGSLVNWATQFVLDFLNNKPLENQFARFPGVAGNVASAIAWGENGVTDKIGATIYEPNTTERVGKALGFTPSGLSQKREERWAVQQAIIFWTTQRSNLQAEYNRALDSGDREYLADVNSEIDKFNDNVLDPRMKLVKWRLNQNYRDHRKEIRQREMGLPDRNVRQLTADVSASFGEEEQ